MMRGLFLAGDLEEQAGKIVLSFRREGANALDGVIQKVGHRPIVPCLRV